MRESIPDPTSAITIQSAKLNWKETTKSSHADWLALYRDLLAIRRREIVPRLRDIGGNSGSFETLGDAAVRVRWKIGGGAKLVLIANLKSRPLGEVKARGRRIWPAPTDAGDMLGSWGVIWSIADEGKQ